MPYFELIFFIPGRLHEKHIDNLGLIFFYQRGDAAKRSEGDRREDAEAAKRGERQRSFQGADWTRQKLKRFSQEAKNALMLPRSAENLPSFCFFAAKKPPR